MLTSADTAARIERLPEWKNVPSPMFWNMCGRSGEGARPIHWAPSPPMCEMLTAPRSIHRTMAWQPTPPPTTEPSGSVVERLCGQPLQKNGLRAVSGSRTEAAADSSSARRASAHSRQPGAETAAEQRCQPIGRQLAVGRHEQASLRASCRSTTRGRSASG